MANNHISDELLAAYLEGNVNKEEMARILQPLKTDSNLQETLDVAIRVEEEELPMLQMAAEGRRNLCDVECEAYVLKQHNIKCDVEDLLKIEKENHWIRRAGTPLNYMGKLLEYKGLNVSRQYDTTIENLKDVLKNEKGVIVAVDSDKLYPERPDEEDATNHAIVVTGIDLDSKEVTFYDPENIAEISIELSLFISAWKESRCYAVCVFK